MNLHKTTKKQNHSGVYFTKQGLFSEIKKSHWEKRVILVTGNIDDRKVGEHLSSLSPPQTPSSVICKSDTGTRIGRDGDGLSDREIEA